MDLYRQELQANSKPLEICKNSNISVLLALISFILVEINIIHGGVTIRPLCADNSSRWIHNHQEDVEGAAGKFRKYSSSIIGMPIARARCAFLLLG